MRRIGLILAVVLVGSLVAAAVAIGSGARNAVLAEPVKPAAALAYDPGPGATGVNPTAPIGVRVSGGSFGTSRCATPRAPPSRAACRPTGPAGFRRAAAALRADLHVVGHRDRGERERGPPGGHVRDRRAAGARPWRAEHRRRPDRRGRGADRDPVRRPRRRPRGRRARAHGADLHVRRGRVGLALRTRTAARASTGPHQGVLAGEHRGHVDRQAVRRRRTAAARSARRTCRSTFTIGGRRSSRRTRAATASSSCATARRSPTTRPATAWRATRSATPAPASTS